jgi:[ribosomal protein S18]-alanine N-acetyltransferase
MTTPLPGAGDRPARLPVASPLFVTPDGLPLRLRQAGEEDLPELHRLDREVFKEHAYPYFTLRQLFDLFRADLFVLDDGRTFHGYVLAGTNSEGQGWILGLAIDQQWRGQGLGRRLMAESLRRLRAHGVRAVRLTVEPGNATAIELYASLGFRRVGRREGYFGPDADRLVMELPLA